MKPLSRSYPLWKTHRRIVFFSLVFLFSTLAAWVMADILWRGGINGIKIALLVLFFILINPVALGIVQATTGFVMIWSGRSISALFRELENKPVDRELPGTALVMPIFNEEVAHVFAGLKATYHSVEKTGKLASFDFFILSDSSDPNKWVEEETAWTNLCKEVNGFGRIFYRKRKVALHRKSGNISDFCRRWGRKYRYMVILDADSVMTGECLVTLARLMEAHPRAGIIQAAPVQALSTSLFGRIMQFSGAMYGPVFQAGLDFWQCDEGNYWGHNAIIRLAPFIEHCALPYLPSSRMPRTKFISHDYVEAALMRRGGYQVWLAHGLRGSYEGGPPTLYDMAQRDYRWCRGNFQHSWLMFSPHIHAINRLHLLLGIMSYLSSLFWLVFMILGTLQFWISSHLTQRTFASDIGFTSFLDIGGNRLAILLYSIIIIFLFFPKLLSLLLVLKSGEASRHFGGRWKAIFSAVLESMFSVLLAPILMLFHSRFVVSAMSRHGVEWKTQQRGGTEGIRWRDGFGIYWSHTLVGILWGTLAWWIHPPFFWWMTPVLAGMVFSIPIGVLSSRVSYGSAWRKHRLLETPQESNPPEELRQLESLPDPAAQRQYVPRRLQHSYGFIQVVIDPYVNAIHIALQHRQGKRSHLQHLIELLEQVLKEGPDVLEPRKQMGLLKNPECMDWLHKQVWQRPQSELNPLWTEALRYCGDQYGMR